MFPLECRLEDTLWINRIIDDMNGIKYENTGFSYSRYKNTDEISWMQFMKKEMEKSRKK